MLPPLVHDNLVHDDTSDLAKRGGADQGFKSLEVSLLHLIFLVFVEEVHLELSQVVHHSGADLTGVDTTPLDQYTVGTF